MFKLGQILTSTQLFRRYREVLNLLAAQPQPLLITQRNGHHMVLVNAEIFEDLLFAKLRADGIVEPESRFKVSAGL